MRTLTSVFSILALTLAIGCGDDGGDGGGGVDAAPSADSMPAGPDAMPAKTPIASGLGQICGGSGSIPCATATDICLVTDQALPGFCSPSCALDLAMDVNPDVAASQACGAGYSGTIPADGTPLCAAPLGQTPPSTNRDWYCAIACGVIGENDAGGCPGGMTCASDNFCSP